MAGLNLFAILVSALVMTSVSTGSRSFGKYVAEPFDGRIGAGFDQNPFARAIARASFIMEDSPSPVTLLHRLHDYVARLPDESRADKAPLRELIDLANIDGRCDSDLPRWFILKYRIIEASHSIEHPEVMLSYLLHFGAEKFHRCAVRARGELSRQVGTNDVLKEFGAFFRRAVFLGDDASNHELYEKLRSIRATTARWNVDMLAQMSEIYRGPRSNPEGHFSRLFYDQCARLEGQFSPMLDIISLASNLSNNADHSEGDTGLLQLFEARRICLERLSNHIQFEQNLATHRFRTSA